LDELKNIAEALEIFVSLSGRQDVMYIIIGQGAREQALIASLREKSLLGSTLLRNEIAFHQASSLAVLVRRHQGIFLSPSKGESFGLSAAEFIASGVPALLSNIPAHRELVNGDERFLYELGSISTAKEKLLALWKDWDAMSKVISSCGAKFTGDAFYTAWTGFLKEQNLA
jgi:glycosyltransferase involved in cell wall biosynthesis